MSRRRSVLALVVLCVAGCRNDGAQTTAPVNLASQQITDDTGAIQVDVGYRGAPEREVEIVVNLKAVGIEEMDKVVADIRVDGFVLVAGTPEWSGFVAPRQPIAHKASFRLLEGNESGTLIVTVQRSANSEVLFETRLDFAADGDRVKPVQ